MIRLSPDVRLALYMTKNTPQSMWWSKAPWLPPVALASSIALCYFPPAIAGVTTVGKAAVGFVKAVDQ